MKSLNISIDNDDLKYFLPSNIFSELNKNNGNIITNKFDYFDNNPKTIVSKYN